MKLTLPKTIERYSDRLTRYDDERSYGNPIFVCYKPGWKSYTDPVGVQHSDAELTVAEIRACIKDALRCDCEECQRDFAAMTARQVLDDLRSISAFTEFEREVFGWAADPCDEMAESEDGVNERMETGETLYEYVRTDVLYRLGEQLPQMTEDTIGTPERMEALRAFAAAKRIVARLTTAVSHGKE